VPPARIKHLFPDQVSREITSDMSLKQSGLTLTGIFICEVFM
jgi:hypothetical protein